MPLSSHFIFKQFLSHDFLSVECSVSQLYLRTVIHNLRILWTETVWARKYEQVFHDLVEKYQDFFCEPINHEENIERHDWRDGLENFKVSFDDETPVIENAGSDRYLQSTENFHDDGLCEAEDSKLAFNLSKLEVENARNSPARARGSGGKKGKKAGKKEKDSAVIIWFRRDLRIYDNPALVKACSFAQPVIPVFLWSDSEEEKLGVGGASKVWLEQALGVFSATLRERFGSRLILRKCLSSQSELLSLVKETGAKRVVWSALYEPQMQQRDAAIKTALGQAGVSVEEEHGYLLHRPDQLSVAGVGAGGLGSVTHFMECCKHNPGDRIGDPLDPPVSMMSPASWPSSCQLTELGLYKPPRRRDGTRVDWAAGIRRSWTFGEEGGYENLRRFLAENVEKYESESGRADQRWTSVISPYLHWGELSPRLVLHEAFVGKIAAKFRRKLAWRDLSYWLLSMFPSMDCEPVRPQYANMRWSTDQEALKKWQKGKTGFPLVDAAMRQLWEMGWMNNYMRHVVASFLISYLRISWVEGYAWFQDTLLDADVAINAMMWQNGGFSGLDQWNFVMHPVNAAHTCDPRGDFVRRWIPELAPLPDKFIHQPWKCPTGVLRRNKVELGVTYPHRCILNLEAERERSLQDVVEVRRKYGGGYLDPRHGRDLLRVPAALLGLKTEEGKKMVVVPLITRKEFLYKTGRPESEDNPYDPVLKGYVSRARDEEVARLARLDFTASTVKEITERKERTDQREGLKGSFGGRGRGRRFKH